MNKSRYILSVAVALVLLQGCMMAGNYHSARTLEKGTSSFGLTFSMHNYVVDGDRYPIPNIIPEITYHIGLTDDLEFGGRVALGSLGIETDVKYRLINTGKLHLAVAPSIGYQGFVIIDGVTTRLPVIVTYDIAKFFSISASGLVQYTHYSIANDGDIDFDEIGGDLLSYGVSIAPEFRGETFFIRPALEWNRYQSNFDDSLDWQPFNDVSFLIHFGWVFGKEKQQLDRIEDKIDALRKE